MCTSWETTSRVAALLPVPPSWREPARLVSVRRCGVRGVFRCERLTRGRVSVGGSPRVAVRRHSEIRITVLRCPPTYFSSILQSGHFKLHVAGGYVLYEFHFVPRGPSNTFVLTKGDGKPKTSPAWENSLSGPLPAQSGPGPRWQLWRLLGGHIVTSGPPPHCALTAVSVHLC